MINNLKLQYHKKEIVLIILIVVFYILTFLYIWKDLPNAPGNRKSSRSYNNINSFYRDLNPLNLNKLFLTLRDCAQAPGYLPVTSFVMLLIGKNYMLVNLIVNTVSLLFLLVSSYLLGNEIGGRRSGVFMVFILSLYPLVYMPFREYFLDFHLMWIVVLSVFLLIKSDFFQIRVWSVLLALACGWGMMVKAPFGAFLSGPVVVGLGMVIQTALKKNYRGVKNFILFMAIFLIVIAPYYFNYNNLAQNAMRPFTTEPPGLAWYSFENLRLFTTGLWEHQLSPPFFMLFLFSIYYFMKKINYKIKMTIILWIIIPNIILILMPHGKSIRYFMPLIPAFAVISAVGAKEIIRKKIGILVIVFIMILGIIQYFIFNCAKNFDPTNLTIKRNKIYISIRYFYPYPSFCWLKNNSDNMYSSPIILSRIKEKVLQRIQYMEGKGIKGYKPVIVAPIQCYHHLGYDWIKGLDTIFWFDNISIEAVDFTILLRDYKQYAGKIDFIMTFTSEQFPYTIEEPNYFKILRQNSLRDRMIDFNIKKPEDWSVIKNNIADIAKKIKYKELLYEEIFYGQEVYRLYLYELSIGVRS